MDLEDELESSKRNLKTRIDIFFWIAVFLGLLSISSFLFYAYFPGKIYNWFPANPHDYANNLSVILASLSGVLFVYIAFLGQRWQMLYQQQEIRDNRQEMQNSTLELKNQAEALTNQISRMDRDFKHQNFFRILEQHFKTRDRLCYFVWTTPEMYPDLKDQGRISFSGEKAFEAFLKNLLKFIDDNKGWNKKLTGMDPEKFERKYDFIWVDRIFDLKISDLPNIKLVAQSNGYNGLSKKQIQFVFRHELFEGSFNTYIRSTFYLLDYVKENNLTNYFKAIESGMGNEERIFMFYFLTTQFELYGEADLKDWLMENYFLYSIKENELLDMEHKILLYPKEGDLPIPYM